MVPALIPSEKGPPGQALGSILLCEQLVLVGGRSCLDPAPSPPQHQLKGPSNWEPPESGQAIAQP